MAASVGRDELVILLRMAADTSGEPLSDGEREILQNVMDANEIDAELAGINLDAVDDTPFEL